MVLALLAICAVVAAIMLAGLLLLRAYPCLHRRFWRAIDLSLHWVLDHTSLGGRLWHWASFWHWACHELAHYTSPNRKRR